MFNTIFVVYGFAVFNYGFMYFSCVLYDFLRFFEFFSKIIQFFLGELKKC